jgi:hypothetical protein
MTILVREQGHPHIAKMFIANIVVRKFFAGDGILAPTFSLGESGRDGKISRNISSLRS